MTVKKSLGLVCVAMILAAAGLFASSGADEPAKGYLEIGELSLTMPSSAQANESFEIEVDGATPGEVVEITVDAGYDNRRFTVEAQSGTTTVTIPALTYPGSGLTIVTASSERKVGRASIDLLPDVAASPIDLYIGPRTVVADTETFSMMVAVPTDATGNPVANGTEISYLVTRPSLLTEESVRGTDGLLSYVEVFSSTVAGRTRLAASVDTATGPERSFLEVAGLPVSFALNPVDPLPPADGQALIRLRTDVLVDEFENELPNGTAVYLDASGATGIRRLQSVTIDGVAEFVLEVPDQPGEVTVIATASGTQSAPNTLAFSSAVTELPVTLTDHPDGTLVSIGRVLSARQNYVPDGTVAEIRTEGNVIELPLELGRAEAIVAETEGSVTVAVLGTSVTENIR